MSLTILKACEEHKQAVVTIAAKLLDSENGGDVSGLESMLKGFMLPTIDDHAIFLAYVHDDLVGGFIGQICQDRTHCLGVGTYVFPKHRRRRIGSRLRKNAFDYLETLGIPKVIGLIREDNKLGQAAKPPGAILTHNLYEIPLKDKRNRQK